MTTDTKKKIFTIIEVIVLTLLIYWVYSDGFTKTLHDATGLSGNSSNINQIIGNGDLGKAIIALLLIIIFFVSYIALRKKGKK